MRSRRSKRRANRQPSRNDPFVTVSRADAQGAGAPEELCELHSRAKLTRSGAGAPRKEAPGTFPNPPPNPTPGRGMRAKLHKGGPIALPRGDFPLRSNSCIKAGRTE